MSNLKQIINSTPELTKEELQNSSISWSEPKPIKSELLPVHTLPSEIIPEPFRPWITDIAYRMQCPPDFIAGAVVVMVSAVIGAGCGIRPKQKDDWLVVPNLWGGIIARPGKLKSPALTESFRPLSRLEADAQEKYDQLKTLHLADVQAYEANKSAIKDRMKQAAKGNGEHKEGALSMDDLKAQLTRLEEPTAPTWRRFKTNDSSIEKIHELSAENERGILIFRDELMGLLSSWDKDGHEQDRAFFLEGWNGYGSMTLDRITRGTIYVKNLCVSLFGGIQPAKLLNYLYQAARGNDNDGLVQRLQVLLYPDEIQNWQLIDQQPDSTAKNRAYRIVETLAKADFTEFGALQGDNDEQPYFTFDDDAQKLFYGWLTELETEKLRGTDEPIILEHLSKYRSLMPSLALIFHLIEAADGISEGSVTLRAAEMAAAWCDYLESHARRIYGQLSTIEQKAASRLAEKLKDGVLSNGFTVRDIYRAGWSFLTDKEVIQSACDELVEQGWLAEQVTEPGYQQKGKIQYLINPKVIRSHE